uniref:Protein kinase domain-containing protein n=1 Tax=Parascaris univalens TaxID=6257 RepID=A0A915AG96_PARUN
ISGCGADALTMVSVATNESSQKQKEGEPITGIGATKDNNLDNEQTTSNESPMRRLRKAIRKLRIQAHRSASEITLTERFPAINAASPFGRLSETFINERLLKTPGDYVISLTHDDAIRLSVMSEDKSIVHLRIIEAKGLFSIKDTLYPTATSIVELLNKFRESQMNVLSAVVGTATALRYAVKGESTYCQHDIRAMFIKDDSQLQYSQLLCCGNVAKTFIGKMNIGNRSESVVVKEMNEYSEEELNKILSELHISNLVRSLTTEGVILHVMAVRLIKSPYLIVYPFIDCGSYPDFALQQGAQLSIFDKIKASETISKALFDMHSFGVLHCDIGARNIFVRKDTRKTSSHSRRTHGKFTFLLGDFRQAAVTTSKNVDPMRPINLRWLAPEVFSTKKLNVMTDVYAFGMTLYEIFTGNVPYYTMRAKDIRRKLIAGELLRPALNDTVETDLSELMRNCWHMEPQERPSMKNVWLRLRAIRDSRIKGKQVQQRTLQTWPSRTLS